jgi:hypothetical protein
MENFKIVWLGRAAAPNVSHWRGATAAEALASFRARHPSAHIVIFRREA